MDEVDAAIKVDGKTWHTVLTCVDSYSQHTTLRLCERHPLKYGEERNLLQINLHGDDWCWRNLKQFLFWLSRGKQLWARQVYKVARTRRNETMQKDWEQALPKDVVRWASERFSAAIERDGLECVDSERVARIGNKSQMRRFVRSRTCCGSAEWEEVCPVDGKRYLLGLNFGH